MENVQKELGILTSLIKKNTSSEKTDVFTLSWISSLEERIAALKSFNAMNADLEKEGFFAMEVPMDGNCGIWSIYALSTSSFDISWKDKDVLDNLHSLRGVVAKNWADISLKPPWVKVFSCIAWALKDTNDDAANAPEPDSKPPQVKTEIEKAKTPPRRKRGPPVFIDLSTPPQKKASTARTAGQQQSAFTSKKPLPSLVPQLPESESKSDEKKTATPDAVEEEQPRGKRRRLRAQMEKLVEEKPKGAKKKANPAELGDEQEEKERPVRRGQKKAKKKRNRTCKSKVKTESERKLRAVKRFLGSRGITWSVVQSAHSSIGTARSGSGKFKRKDAADKKSEFLTLQNCLVKLQEPGCPRCVMLLRSKGVEMSELQEFLEKAANPEFSSPQLIKMVSKQPLESESENEGNDNKVVFDVSGWEIVPYEGPSEKDGAAEERQEDSAAAAAKEYDLAMAYMKKQKYLELMPFNTMDKRVPIRCKVCKSSSQLEGKVFEGDRFHKKSLEHFVNQHCSGSNHIAALGRLHRSPLPSPSPTDSVAQEDTTRSEPEINRSQESQNNVPCQGLSLTGKSSRIEEFKQELLLWARYTKLTSALQHYVYTFNVTTEDLVVHHENCWKLTPEPEENARPTCAKCDDLKIYQNTLRSALRFALKHWAARMLEARLFQSDEVLEGILKDFRATHMYKVQVQKSEEVIKMNNLQLQRWVRQSWMKVRRDLCSELPLGWIKAFMKCGVVSNIIQ